MKVEGLIIADKERWQSLYRGYADFYQMPMNEEILESVWYWRQKSTGCARAGAIRESRYEKFCIIL